MEGVKGLEAKKQRQRHPRAYLHVLATLVKLWLPQQHVSRNVSIQHPSHKLGKRREEQIKEYQIPLVNHGRSGEAAEELEPK